MNNFNKLKKLGTIVNFKKNDLIFLEGDQSNSFYIILVGSVSIYRSNLYDNSKVELVQLNEGDIFGEMAIISHDLRSASISSISDTTCLEIPSYNFEEFLTIEPKYAINFIRTLANRKADILKKIRESEVTFSG